MNEPKPQTPLTDAFFTAYNLRGIGDIGDFARSLELKLQEAERQRDEARQQAEYWLKEQMGQATARANESAERDQLIKVVDAYASCTSVLRAMKGTSLSQANKAYSILPHVQAKKGIEI